MKKIGILTFHFADNYGAVLQCFALRKKILSYPNCQVDIINYVPPLYKYIKYENTLQAERKFQEKRRLFRSFLSKQCGISDKYISCVSDGYDYYCVGSDQVWGTHHVEYFLPNVKKGKKVSYAASIGFPIGHPRINKNILVKYLPEFDSVSVRELEHVKLVEEVTGRNCQCVLDPSLLLEAFEYDSVVSKEQLEEEEFVFFFWLEHDDNLLQGVEFANSIARKYNLKIVHSIPRAEPHMFCKESRCMKYEGVENFLWYEKHARFVVTNSYHATLFALQFRTPFYVFVVEHMRTRIDTINKKFGLSDRVVEGYIPIENITENVGFDAIWEKIEQERVKSVEYLESSLELKD